MTGSYSTTFDPRGSDDPLEHNFLADWSGPLPRNFDTLTGEIGFPPASFPLARCSLAYVITRQDTGNGEAGACQELGNSREFSCSIVWHRS